MISMSQIRKELVNRSFWLYLLIALVFAMTVDYKKAARERTRYLLGVFYNQELSNYSDGIVYFDYLSHIRPDDGRNYFFLGYCYLFLHQYDKASYYFKHAIALEPSNQDWKIYLDHAQNKLLGKADIPLPTGPLAIPTE